MVLGPHLSPSYATQTLQLPIAAGPSLWYAEVGNPAVPATAHTHNCCTNAVAVPHCKTRLGCFGNMSALATAQTLINCTITVGVVHWTQLLCGS